MATTVGETVLSEELVVAQFDEATPGTTVESLVIKFDQAKYEEYLSSAPVSGKKSCGASQALRPQATKAARPLSSTQTVAGGSTHPEAQAPSQKGQRWVVIRPTQMSQSKQTQVRVGADHTITVDMNTPLSKRARQRRRQAQARKEAHAHESLDGLNYYSNLKNRVGTENSAEASWGEVGDSDRPHKLGGVHHSRKIPSVGEFCEQIEERLGELETAGEHHPQAEPRPQGRKTLVRQRRGQAHLRTTNGRLPNHHGRFSQAGDLNKPRPSRQARRNQRLASFPELPQKALSYECSHDTGGGEQLPAMDLRDHLTRKRSIQGTTPRCHCERLITAVLEGCQCDERVRPSVFERLSSQQSAPRLPHRKRNRTRKQNPEDLELPVATVNVTGKSRAKSPDPADAERWPRLRGLFVEPEGIFQHTRTQRGIAIPLDYRKLAAISDEEDEDVDDDCSAIAASQASSSGREGHARAHMTGIPDDLAKKLEDQQAAITQQQGAIDAIKTMLEQILNKKTRKKKGPRVVSKSSSKNKEKEHVSPHTTDREEDSESSSSSSSGSSIGTSNPNLQSKRLDDFQSQLDALKHQKSMSDSGVVRPYPIEWDTVPYPAKFKPTSLVQFDGRGSPSQHIYYFLSQTGFLTGNDPILARLFIGTLKGVAFEWFRKLEPGTIKSWTDLEKLFLTRFFDDDTEVSMSTLLTEKQKKAETVGDFVKRFRNRALHCRDQVSESTLIEMCRNNLSIHILSKVGAVETRTWKELVRQGEQVENVLARLQDEDPQYKKADHEQNFSRRPPRVKGKETMAVENTPTPKPVQKQKNVSSEPRIQRQYDFRDDQVVTIFKTLLKGNKIKLPEVKRQDEAGRVDDPNYCAYHRMVHHPTSKCYILKDKIQALFEAGVLKKEVEHKKVTTNMVTLRFGTGLPEVSTPSGVIPIPAAELRVINIDPYDRLKGGLVPQTMPCGRTMWVHPDLLQDEQWTSKSQRKQKHCNVVSAILDDSTTQAATLTDSDNETQVLVTRAGKEFAKQYPPATGDQVSSEIPGNREPKGKELAPTASGRPFRFDVLKQLANIPARITLYELLRLSRPTREALQEALADAEAFTAHISPPPEEDKGECLQCCLASRQKIPCITFTPDDMLLKNTRHDRPLYFTGYIGSTKVDRIQVDPGSALSIIPLRLIRHLGVPRRRLSSTNTTIYGFNATGTSPLGKIRLKCRLGDMKTEVTCYVIDAEPSYNMLLGRPWIHSNLIVPSTLHQCMKYVNQHGQVKTVFAEERPFKGVENYFTDSLLYQDYELEEEPPSEGTESGNEADGESECDPGLVLNDFEPIVINYENPDVPGDVLNEDYNFAYFLSTDSASTSSESDYGRSTDLILGLLNDPSISLPVQSMFTMNEQMSEISQACFIVPTRKVGQEDIVFGRIECPLHTLWDDPEEDESPPSFTCYGPVSRHIMENMGYDFSRKEGLNSGKGRRTPLKPLAPKGKPDDYYHQTRRGLGYVSPSSGQERGPGGEHEDTGSSSSAAWDSDVSVGEVFKHLNVNMTTTGFAGAGLGIHDHSYDETWDKHVNAQWSGRFGQREPPSEDKILQVNMGDEVNPKPIFISDSLPPQEKEALISLIREYIDVFAWNYEDMPGLDPQVAMHKLNIKPGARPVKQQQRRFRPQIMEAIEVEVKKLIDSGFIREEQHPEWVANIVPVLKKNGKIRVCIDFRDLNAACPKDEFPLPITDVIIDNTCGFERMSFMDGFSGYNQIKMHPEDEKHTSFRTPSGIFCYTVMPFGLKNAGATYQRAMSTIFRDHLRKTVECYVDDLVVKSHDKEDHIDDLKAMFEIMRTHQLKMNPTKSFLGMSSGKFLGFVVTTKGIRLDPDKVRAIQELRPPRNLKELRGLQGRLAYIRRFIANLSGKCQPFAKLMKKGVSFVWDEACQKAFEEIKGYLSNPPVLTAPNAGKPFLIYIRAMEHSLAGLLAQDDDQGHEQAVYYLSRTLIGAEHRYPMVEKECLALVFAVQKMRHYLVGQTVHVISRVNPIRVFMTQPGSLNWRLTRWALLLSQYDIHFMPQKAVKGQAICDLMASHPIRHDTGLFEDMPDETHEVNITSQEEKWQLFFDGASRTNSKGMVITGVGVVLVSPQNIVLPKAFSLTEPCSNNVAEYNALLIGLQLAKELGVKCLDSYGDSQLIVRQVTGEYEVRNNDLIPCHKEVMEMTKSFETFSISHVPRRENTHADALAALATTLALPLGTNQQITVASRQLSQPKYAADANMTRQVEDQLGSSDWRFPIIDYVLYGILPEDPKERDSIRRRAPRFYYNSVTKTLYRRAYDGMLLRCLSEKEAQEALEEAHTGTGGAHQPGPKLCDRLRRMGYYWPKMIRDAMAHTRRCHACQIHANYLRQPPEDLHPTASSWPFEIWGMDVVGPISPPSAKGHRFILAITDYFSKWAEAIPLREVKASDVIRFIKHRIIYRYGIPRRIIHDNGSQFVSHAFTRFCDKFRIQNLASTAYNPTANGLAEAFNKTIVKILTKMTSLSKRDWDEKLGESLWAYRTTVRTPTGTTPYSLVYGCEAVLPLEIQIPSLRVALAAGMTSEESHRKRLQELEALDEKRLEAQQHIEFYQARMSKAFNKKVKRRTFKEGDLVLAVRRPMILNSKKKGKFQPKWEGPFVVETVYSNGAYRLVNQSGDKIMMPINGKFLKEYYP